MANPAYAEAAGAADRVSLSTAVHPADQAGAAEAFLAVRAVTLADQAGAADGFKGSRAVTLAEVAAAAEVVRTAYDAETLWYEYIQAKETAIAAETTFRQTVNGNGIGFSGPQYLSYYQAQMAADEAYNAYLLMRNPRRPLD